MPEDFSTWQPVSDSEPAFSGRKSEARSIDKLNVTPTGVVSTFVTGLSFPFGVDRDASGNLYVTEIGKSRVSKITPAGVVSVLAGSGNPGYADGTGPAAEFIYPGDVAVNANGDVFVGDYGSLHIRKITPAGVTTTVAGSGVTGIQDGLGDLAQLGTQLYGMTVDALGNVYLSDTENRTIRKITLKLQ